MKADATDKQNEHWVTHPTKKNLLIIVTVWFVGISLQILAVTDLFTESFFNKRYIFTYALMVMSTWITFKVVSNYLRAKGTANN